MEALLPKRASDACSLNAGLMELGAIVCTARSPRCDDCPLKDACRWRAAGYPDYEGPRKPAQKKYAGSDRHVRGLIMRELRASHIPVASAEIERLWPDATQLERALAGLLKDGLTIEAEGGYTLP